MADTGNAVNHEMEPRGAGRENLSIRWSSDCEGVANAQEAQGGGQVDETGLRVRCMRRKPNVHQRNLQIGRVQTSRYGDRDVSLGTKSNLRGSIRQRRPRCSHVWRVEELHAVFRRVLGGGHISIGITSRDHDVAARGQQRSRVIQSRDATSWHTGVAEARSRCGGRCVQGRSERWVVGIGLSNGVGDVSVPRDSRLAAIDDDEVPSR